MQQLTDKLYSWASIIDDVTREQAEKTSRLGIVRPHVAVMPDAHWGMGSTVGTVLPTHKALIPAAVGVDIGCGMIAVETQFRKEDLLKKDLSVLRHSIERSIPLSAGNYNSQLSVTAAERVEELLSIATRDYSQIVGNWELHLGTLGSGNHFIEISYDEKGTVWIFLHSGSRGIGNKIAQGHIKIAQKICTEELEDPNLAYLFEGTDEFAAYLRDLLWAQKFALLNREEMMDRVITDLSVFMGYFSKIELSRINCHHNFTQPETHFGEDLWITRKGAISANLGEFGLIPGSMGTASYVVSGKGNPLSYNSSPHGAGRVYSRGKAKKTFTLEQLKEAMIGIEFNPSEAFLDEIPAAYKDVNIVMQDSADLVDIVHELHQLVNVKGA